MILNRDAILGVKLKTKKITVPLLGGDVIVRELTGDQRGEIEILSMNIKDDKKAYKMIRPMIAAMCLVDEEGNRLFTDADAEILGKTLSGKVLDQISDALGELNEATEDSIKK